MYVACILAMWFLGNGVVYCLIGCCIVAGSEIELDWR